MVLNAINNSEFYYLGPLDGSRPDIQTHTTILDYTLTDMCTESEGDFETLKDIGSDHRPTLTTINIETLRTQPARRTLKNVNWTEYCEKN